MTGIRLALGAMMFGITIDERTSFALLDRFVEAGGEWIDTADCYAFWASESGYGGDSERLLGRWLKARPDARARVKISTKVGAEPRDKDDWPASREGLSPTAVRTAAEGSLRRLGIERVDLLWAHMEDRTVPIEQTAEAFGALVSDGLTKRVGTSNHPAWRVERARRHALERGLRPVDALQHSRSYLRPRPGVLPPGQNHRFGMLDDELVDLAATEKLDIWAYTPLLSGAYDNPAKPIPEAYDHPGNRRRLEVLDEVARELGASRGQVVLAWLVGGRPSITPILGGSKPEQLESALEAVRLELPEELRTRLDEVDATSPA
ncbi:aryl-alcohol dehydrogenase-like predicted oxidoreductase [Diaminobutyricimonas aerilata]|uniref:Aryl-alcohol dehydrogenase-like predicted oxidoreductase n=1 Tax=Diaminobutyricimonas aerilata TaxID=1162967 RepID=A0A2M9CFW6_9MICO|nr:aldo/keto reductase [Diaminobutyricimonas aerilata]PJJ70779.1 aryl-alcohol dehydrogenase-like predicted oxidoreductase [Diaminobutyricimonas aerilata]